MTSFYVVGILAAVAVGMVAVTSELLRWAAVARTHLRAMVIVFLLVMMTGMLLGAAVYFLAPAPRTLVEGFWIASAVMSASVLLVFFEFLREANAARAGGGVVSPSPIRRARAIAATVVGLVILNEILMGWTFQRAAGGPVWLGGSGLEHLLPAVFVSPWFVFPMALEMSFTLAWLAPEFPPSMVGLLAFPPVVMAFSPPSLPGATWIVASAIGASGAMAGALGYVFLRLYRGEDLPGSGFRYAGWTFAAFGAMAAGLALWALTGGIALFAASMLLQMLVFLVAVTHPRAFAPDPPGERPVRS